MATTSPDLQRSVADPDKEMLEKLKVIMKGRDLYTPKEAKEARKQKEEDAKRDRQQNRKQFATLIMKHFWSKRSEGICIRDDNEYLEIYNDRIKEKIYYVDEKFKTLLSHVLSKLGLEQPKFLGQIA